jgi:hypothetical protein
MTVRIILKAGGVAAVLLLMSAAPVDAQVIVNRGINPWTGLPYRHTAVYNPWTGRVAVGGIRTHPWTGTTVRGGHWYNPWTGRGVSVGVARNPWTGERRWGVSRRRGWW